MANRLDIDSELIRKLAELLDETGLSEIEYETGGRSVRVARQINAHNSSIPSHTGEIITQLKSAPETTPLSPTPEKRDGTPVTAPMVGTVFLAPEPGADPYVKLGDIINEGDTVMLIEAMKTYNPVRAPRAGKVVRILVTDTAPVEYGEELMVLE